MPGGFLKKSGTAWCGMTGTLVASALVCAASGSRGIDTVPPRTTAATDHATHFINLTAPIVAEAASRPVDTVVQRRRQIRRRSIRKNPRNYAENRPKLSRYRF